MCESLRERHGGGYGEANNGDEWGGRRGERVNDSSDWGMF